MKRLGALKTYRCYVYLHPSAPHYADKRKPRRSVAVYVEARSKQEAKEIIINQWILPKGNGWQRGHWPKSEEGVLDSLFPIQEGECFWKITANEAKDKQPVELYQQTGLALLELG